MLEIAFALKLLSLLLIIIHPRILHIPAAKVLTTVKWMITNNNRITPLPTNTHTHAHTLCKSSSSSSDEEDDELDLSRLDSGLDSRLDCCLAERIHSLESRLLIVGSL